MDDTGLKLVFAGAALAFGPFVVGLYLAAGPTLWFAVGGIFVLAGIARGYSGGDDEGDANGPTTNCPNCGARVPADAECEYCGAST